MKEWTNGAGMTSRTRQSALMSLEDSIIGRAEAAGQGGCQRDRPSDRSGPESVSPPETDQSTRIRINDYLARKKSPVIN